MNLQELRILQLIFYGIQKGIPVPPEDINLGLVLINRDLKNQGWDFVTDRAKPELIDLISKETNKEN